MNTVKFTLLSSTIYCMSAFAAMAADTSGVPSGPAPQAKAAALPSSSVDSPYQLQLLYTAEEWGNRGGAKDGSVFIQQAFAGLNINTDKAFGLTGGDFKIQGFYNSKRSLDKLAGDYEDQSVLDTGGTEMVRLYQVYYDQNIASTQTDLRLGIQDLQTEFGNTKPMGLFFGGSYAWTTTLDQISVHSLGADASTNHATALAFRVRQEINNQWDVQAAVADGMPDDSEHPKRTAVIFDDKGGEFAIGQVNYRPIHGTKIMAGIWGSSGKFEDLHTTNAAGDVASTHGNVGGYFGGATRLYDQGEGRGLDGFTTIGLAESSVNQANRTINMGLTYTGPLDIRPEDKVGIAFSTSGISNAYKNSQTIQGKAVDTYESNFEVTYRAKVNDYITLQPDAQYFINPNMDPSLKNDLVVGIHVEIGHVFGL